VVCRFVDFCRSVTVVSSAETTEPIEMPFGLRTRVDTGNHVLDGGPDLPWKGAILKGKGMSRQARQRSDISCAKTAEPIDIPFGCRLGWAQETTY